MLQTVAKTTSSNQTITSPYFSFSKSKKLISYIINSKEAQVIYIPNFISDSQASKYYKILKDKVEWEQEAIIMMGKPVTPPRKISSYGDEGTFYRYSGSKRVARKWLDELLVMRDQVRKKVLEICKEDCNFNFALLNYYRDGKDYIGPHSDSELDIKKNSIIASVTLGAERDFVFQHKKTKERKVVSLANGSLLLMGGQCQRYYKHSLPKRLGVNRGRINITYRQMTTGKT